MRSTADLHGKYEEAQMIEQRLDLAIARTDVPIEASCYCRLTHVPEERNDSWSPLTLS